MAKRDQEQNLQPYPPLYNLALGAQRDLKFHVCRVRAGGTLAQGHITFHGFIPGRLFRSSRLI